VSDVEREITLPLDPGEAWRLVTDERHLERWLAPEVELDPVEGGGVRIAGGDEGERTGVVEEVEAPRRLRWYWTSGEDDQAGSTVEITVLPHEGGSQVRVIERRVATVLAFPARPLPAAEPQQGPVLLAA
jgi:uncharacterized protein YndB with AHSA1/START domain